MAIQFQRKVLILSLIAGALAVAYALGLVFSPVNVQKRRAEAPLLPELKTDQVTRMLLEGSEGKWQLEKRNQGWTVLIAGEEFPASSEHIEAFFSHLASIRRKRVVSANPDMWADFEVGEGAKRRLTLLDSSGGALAKLIAGKSETGERGDFVRLEGSNEVILTDKALSLYMDMKASYWSYLKFFGGLQGKDIMRVSVRSALRFKEEGERRFSYTLIQSEEKRGGWQVLEPSSQRGTALDDGEVDLVAGNLADFEGSEFALAAKDTGLDSPAAEVLFSTLDNKDYRLLIGNRSGEDQYYARSEGSSYLYLVPEWRIKAVLKPLEELRPKQEKK